MKRSVIFTKKYRILILKCLIPSNPYVVTNHHLSYQNPPVFFHKNTTFQKNPHVLFHKTLFSQKHYISYQKHLNPSNYKTCLYNLFVYLYTKNTKYRPVFFHKNTTFQKNPHVFFHKTLFSQKHYISYQKHLNPSNYKTCLYNLFVYLHTKNTKDRPVFFHKNTTFQKNPHVFFHKNTTFHIKNT